jgi:hypothetical protein
VLLLGYMHNFRKIRPLYEVLQRYCKGTRANDMVCENDVHENGFYSKIPIQKNFVFPFKISKNPHAS